jgi:hypothetical protein
MMSEGFLQMTLAQDRNFLTRLSYLLVQQARVVMAEAPTTPGHTQRATYATLVINNPSGMTGPAAVTIVGGPNVIGTVTLEDSGPVTTATDAALTSQIATYWDALAGVVSA